VFEILFNKSVWLPVNGKCSKRQGTADTLMHTRQLPQPELLQSVTPQRHRVRAATFVFDGFFLPVQAFYMNKHNTNSDSV